MKNHWKSLPEASGLRRNLEALLAEPYVMTDGRKSTAQADKQAMELAWSHGLDTDPPRTFAIDRINSLKVQGTPDALRELNRLYQLEAINLEAEAEQRNVVRWTAMRRWAAEPSTAELQAEQAKRADEAAREALIESRALAIVAEENRAALERARAQARKEMEIR